MAVTIAERIHLYPFRTQKLSSLTPKVLGFAPGRIGSCRLLLLLSSVGSVTVHTCIVTPDEGSGEVEDSQEQPQPVVEVDDQ